MQQPQRQARAVSFSSVIRVQQSQRQRRPPLPSPAVLLSLLSLQPKPLLQRYCCCRRCCKSLPTRDGWTGFLVVHVKWKRKNMKGDEIQMSDRRRERKAGKRCRTRNILISDDVDDDESCCSSSSSSSRRTRAAISDQPPCASYTRTHRTGLGKKTTQMFSRSHSLLVSYGNGLCLSPSVVLLTS